MLTTLHYADDLERPRDNQFRLAYAKAYKLQPDVYAVQGYDAAQLLDVGLKAVKGDLADRARLNDSDGQGPIDSPRGVQALRGAQPGAGHLSAQGRGRPEQSCRRGNQGAGRPGGGLPDAGWLKLSLTAGQRPCSLPGTRLFSEGTSRRPTLTCVPPSRKCWISAPS